MYVEWKRRACSEICSLHPCVISGPDYVGHRLIIYTGQFALVNLMGGMKVDDELEGVQDENHKT